MKQKKKKRWCSFLISSLTPSRAHMRSVSAVRLWTDKWFLQKKKPQRKQKTCKILTWKWMRLLSVPVDSLMSHSDVSDWLLFQVDKKKKKTPIMSTWTERVNFLWQENEPGSDRREKRERSVSVQYVPELTIPQKIFRLSVTSFKSHLISFQLLLRFNSNMYIISLFRRWFCFLVMSLWATSQPRSAKV